MSHQQDRLVLHVPRELKSPNCWQGRHWRFKHRESQDWEKQIWVVLAQRTGAKNYVEVLACMNAIQPRRVCQEKRRVIVTRFVPCKRNFIRDDDNLRFAVKPLLDALKRLGLIYNDSRRWIDLPVPTQDVSPDGRWRTVIEITKVNDAKTKESQLRTHPAEERGG